MTDPDTGERQLLIAIGQYLLGMPRPPAAVGSHGPQAQALTNALHAVEREGKTQSWAQAYDDVDLGFEG